ncbi:MAG: arsenate reductase ArsC [Nitrosopumilus sp.]
MVETEKILFVCVENAGRSQIAEAFFRKYAPEKFQAISAGTNPGTKINPIVVEAMKEVGIDISQKPKSLSNAMIKSSFRTVNMGCMNKEECPTLFVKDVLDWEIEDPKGKSIEEVRVIRDHIKSKILELIEQLEKNQ